MGKKEKEQKIEVRLQPLNHNTIKISIVGKTPLLMDKMPESVKKGILDKQRGITKSAKKKIRDLDKEYQDALHKTNTGIIGFPAEAFKKGMMECTSFVGDKFFSKKLVSGAVKIINGVDGLIPIKYKKLSKLKHNIEHNVKISPQLEEWSCELQILYDANNISPTDIATLINYAGFYIGIGSWRPKGRNGGSGSYGMYEVKVK